MEQLFISPYLLALIFFVIALLHSSVGLGGGSSYTALLTIFGASYIAIPSVSLTLNILVASLGSYNFIRAGHARWPLILPFLISSIPFAYLGGSLHLPVTAFNWLLFISLLLVVTRIYLPITTSFPFQFSSAQRVIVSLTSGAILGFIAGAVGIGGGIYLIPLILLLGLGTAKQAAAAGVVFVLVNSVIGMIARFQADRIDLTFIAPLLVAVIIGGWLGSTLGALKFRPIIIERILGLVIVIAVLLLLRKLL